MTHFLTISDFSKSQFEKLLDLAVKLKTDLKHGRHQALLAGKTVGMIFEKPSNRTRVSFEVGLFQLGAHGVYIQKQDIGMGDREPVSDVARVLSRYNDAVLIRALSHSTITEFAHYASVPVINGLSDLYHPCQAVADVLTILAHKKRLDGLKVCYVGDGNNVCVSLVQLCQLLGMEVVVACPKGYEPPVSGVTVVQDVMTAVSGADVVYTDVWVSMGQEAETQKRLHDFSGYEVTLSVLAAAKSDVTLLHCLPANRGKEVSHEAIESAHSAVFDQAENRLHAQKAILVSLLHPEYSFLD